MAHPFNADRENIVEHRRVAHITKGYKAGGAVHSDEKEDKALFKKMYAAAEKKEEKAAGGAVKTRLDRPQRARGGRLKSKKGGTNVNILVGGAHPPAAGAPPLPGPMAGAMPPRPPVAPMPVPPPGGPPGGLPPPGMVPPPGGLRQHGGPTGYAKGGKVVGTPVQHTNAKQGDIDNMGRGKPITYAKGGRISGEQSKAMAPHLPGGAGGGKARLAKARMAKRG